LGRKIGFEQSIIFAMSYFFVTATLFESLQGFALVSAYIFASIFMIIPVISYFLTPSFDYNNKHVIVTGGSSGIGLECAKIYAKRGANVTIVARDQVKLNNRTEWMTKTFLL
jgi:NADPH:quinone reductase-like Zn-dependent oxidoreductase